MPTQAGFAPRKAGDELTADEHIIIPKHGFAPRRGDDVPLGEFVPAGKFGRMFPELLPFTPPIDALDELGAAMVENAPPTDNADIPSGFTYFGQFVDHDITLDTTTLKELIVDPLALQNFRTPMLDLD